MKPSSKTLYRLSIYFVSNVIVLTSCFAITGYFLFELEWWETQVGLLLISLYSFITVRQLYTHGRIWPRKVLLLIFPFPFLFFFTNTPHLYAVGLFIVQLFFWCVSYWLSGRLAKLSPYGGPSGYL
jgi:hypothetical protein